MTKVKTSRATRGITLPEILIAGALLLLVLGVAAELTKLSYQTFLRATRSSTAVREQTIAVDLLSRELRLCNEILGPGKEFREYQPGAGDSELIFRRFSPTLDRDTVVSYTRDNGEETLVRSSLDPDFDLSRPVADQISSLRSPKTVSKNVLNFQVELLDPDLNYGAFFCTFQIRIKSGEGQSLVESTVRLRSI